jgi:hypothetical protein
MEKLANNTIKLDIVENDKHYKMEGDLIIDFNLEMIGSQEINLSIKISDEALTYSKEISSYEYKRNFVIDTFSALQIVRQEKHKKDGKPILLNINFDTNEVEAYFLKQ